MDHEKISLNTVNSLNNNLKIGILYGGFSNEREIALISGNTVFEELKVKFPRTELIDVNEKFSELLPDLNCDVFYLALHGEFGEDGGIQEILETNHKKYTGSNAAACKLTFDKVATKKLLLQHRLPTPAFFACENIPSVNPEMIENQFAYPWVVKPNCGGSSIGLYFINSAEELRKNNYENNLLIEEKINGKELTVAIVDDKPLPVIEIIAENSTYDFHAKYNSDRTQYLFHTLPQNQEKEISNMAMEAYRISGLRDIARVDIMLDHEHRPFILEINATPGMTSHSLVPKAAKENGISFLDLCEKIILNALNRDSG